MSESVGRWAHGLFGRGVGGSMVVGLVGPGLLRQRVGASIGSAVVPSVGCWFVWLACRRHIWSVGRLALGLVGFGHVSGTSRARLRRAPATSLAHFGHVPCAFCDRKPTLVACWLLFRALNVGLLQPHVSGPEKVCFPMVLVVCSTQNVAIL